MAARFRCDELAKLRPGASYHNKTALTEAFGGTPYKGIIYPAQGDCVMTVSTPVGNDDYGYRDRWLDGGKRRYHYFGEWSGCHDMTPSAGNLAIVDRSPNVFLFIREDRDGPFVYQGRFRVQPDADVVVTRPACGHRHKALTFVLNKI